MKSLISKLEQQATFTNTYVNESGSSIFDLKHVIVKREKDDKPTCIAYDNVFEEEGIAHDFGLFFYSGKKSQDDEVAPANSHNRLRCKERLRGNYQRRLKISRRRLSTGPLQQLSHWGVGDDT